MLLSYVPAGVAVDVNKKIAISISFAVNRIVFFIISKSSFIFLNIIEK